jgi:protease I
MAGLSGKTVAIIAVDFVEDAELTTPRDTLREAGADVRVYSPEGDPIQAVEGTPSRPGRSSGRLLVSAGLVAGRRLTSYSSLSVDIKNAGGDWVDEEVVVDHHLITSRDPGDLKAFVGALEDALAG